MVRHPLKRLFLFSLPQKPPWVLAPHPAQCWVCSWVCSIECVRLQGEQTGRCDRLSRASPTPGRPCIFSIFADLHMFLGERPTLTLCYFPPAALGPAQARSPWGWGADPPLLVEGRLHLEFLGKTAAQRAGRRNVGDSRNTESRGLKTTADI